MNFCKLPFRNKLFKKLSGKVFTSGGSLIYFDIMFLFSADQEEAYSIIEMAYAVKYISKLLAATSSEEGKEISNEDLNVQLVADLQVAQDEETRLLVETLKEKVRDFSHE